MKFSFEELLSKILRNDENLTSIECSDYQLTSIEMQILFRTLKQNNVIESLGLSYCNLTDNLLTHLSKLLKTNKSITNLVLSKNKFTSKGLNCILNVIQDQSNIKVLVLSGNKKIDSDGIKSIANTIQHPSCPIKILMLCDLNISNNDIINLSKALVTNNCLIDLNLNDNCISTVGIRSLLQRLKSKENNCLKTISFQNNHLTTKSFQQFQKLFLKL